MSESIHDLFARVKAHPDFMFGTIFVRDDVEESDQPVPESEEERCDLAKWGEEALCRAGWEYLDLR